MTIRTKILGLIYLLTGAAALYGALWWLGAWYLGGMVDDWVEKQRVAGWTVEYAEKTKSGFPFEWRTKISSPRMAGPIGEGRNIDWRGEYLFVKWSPWQPKHLALISGGEHRVEAAGKDLPTRLDINLHKIVALIGLGRDLPRQYGIKADGVSVAAAGQKPVSVTRFIADTTLQAPDETQQGVPEKAAVAADLYGLTLPEGIEAPLGRTISRASLEAGLSGELRGAENRAAMFARWRDSGGVIDLRKFDADWGAVSLRSSGTYTLDSNLRPLAALKLELTGFQQALDALTRTGAIRPSQLLLLRFGLRALSTPDPSGGEKISISIAAQDGWLSVGPVKLIQLKPVAN